MSTEAPATFLPIEAMSCIDATTAAAGSLIFMPAHHLRHYALIGAGPDGSRYLFDLGEERPFGVWVNERDLGPAVLIPGWRLETDPTSVYSRENASLCLGHAYAVDGEAGLIGMIQPHQRQKVAISTAGVAGTAGHFSQQRAQFSRWRIVVGPADRPMTLVDSRKLSVPVTDE